MQMDFISEIMFNYELYDATGEHKTCTIIEYIKLPQTKPLLVPKQNRISTNLTTKNF